MMRTSVTPVEMSSVRADVAYGLMPNTERATSKLSSKSPLSHELLAPELNLIPAAHREAGGSLKEAATPFASAGELWLLDAASRSHASLLLTPIASWGD